MGTGKRTQATDTSRTVLVVEDNEQMASILVDSLSERGFSPSWTNNGIEAIIRCLKARVDLLVTDVFLPKISGLDVVRILRAANPALRTIAITGYPSQNILTELQQLQVDAFLVKPFLIADFLKTVRYALSAARPGGPAALP